MGAVLHPSAGTTPATRKEIQDSKESLKKLAKRYGITVNTVMKWKKRDFVHDAPRVYRLIRNLFKNKHKSNL